MIARRPAVVKIDLQKDSHFPPRGFNPTFGLKGGIISTLNKYLLGVENRYKFLRWVFGKSHASELTRGQWYALRRMCSFYKDDEGAWHTRPEFVAECIMIFVQVCSKNNNKGDD